MRPLSPLASPPASTPPRQRIWKRIWRHLRDAPLGNWLAALLFVALPFVVANVLTQRLLPGVDMRDLRNIIKTVALVAAYAAYVRCWERRPVHELSPRRAWLEVPMGLLLGGALFAAIIAVLAAIGVYTIDAQQTPGSFWAVVATMLPRVAAGAVIEELVFRLLLLALLERSLGSRWALALSSLLFGLAHIGNTGATPAIAVMLGVELGTLFGAAYLLTRSLWFCAALHLAWNFMQGPVFGISVSGQAGDSWLHGSLAGPMWLTGGAFGAEGSLVAVAVALAAAAWLLTWAHRRGRVQPRRHCDA